MSKNLVIIVESPAKAKTIQSIYRKISILKSSFGHSEDLPKKGMGIDLKTFTPDYEVSADKKIRDRTESSSKKRNGLVGFR